MGSVDGLKSRIKNFILASIFFARKIPKDEIGRVFINQFLRSCTSIGANFEEGSQSVTDKDLVYKLSVVKKEAGETLYWLELIIEVYPNLEENGKVLIQECSELIRIFASIIHKKNNNLIKL